MFPFEDLIKKAQDAEVEAFDKAREEERKLSEELRLQHHPGTISGRDLLKERVNPEDELNRQLDEAEAASRRAEKEKKDAERIDPQAPFPPPPITTPG